MPDIIDRLREAALLPFATSEELLVEAADELDQLHCRIIALEAELGTAYGAMRWPSKDQRDEFRLQVQAGSVDP